MVSVIVYFFIIIVVDDNAKLQIWQGEQIMVVSDSEITDYSTLIILILILFLILILVFVIYIFFI